jgi:hypothetical protein
MNKVKIIYMEVTLNYMAKSGKVIEVQELIPRGEVKNLKNNINYLIVYEQ